MGLNNTSPGFFSSGEFSISGLPWVVSSTTSGTSVVRYSLPKVTKNIVFNNIETSAANRIRVGFTENGVLGTEGDRYFVVNGGQSVVFDARVKDIFVRADTSGAFKYSMYCSLTSIGERFMPTLTGSMDGVIYWEGIG